MKMGFDEHRTPNTELRTPNDFLVLHLPLIPYQEAWTLQHQIVSQKKEGAFPDILILLEHSPVITIGRWGKEKGLRVTRAYLEQEGISLVRCERGGDITYHGPGQLVAYPIMNLTKWGLGIKEYVHLLEEVLIGCLRDFGVRSSRKNGFPGVWVQEQKIASLGIAVQKGISFHGLALNYNHRKDHFDLIHPCGQDKVRMTSIQEMKGQPINPDLLRACLVNHFHRIFKLPLASITMDEVRRMLETGNRKSDNRYSVLDKKSEPSNQQRATSFKFHVSSFKYPVSSIPAVGNPQSLRGRFQPVGTPGRRVGPYGPEASIRVIPKPPWLRKKIPFGPERAKVKELIRRGGLHTVCQEACCPNQGECFGQGTATFLLMGNRCTRNCNFCAVSPGRPDPLDPEEPFRIAQAIQTLGVSYAVLTSVTRDDLPDGGTSHFVQTIQAIRHQAPETNLECLIPDFKGLESALAQVAEAAPEVLNHNIETVNRLYPRVRPEAGYEQSLNLLKYFKQKYSRILTKSGFMIGLGETEEEIRALLLDLFNCGCEIITIGQYLQPKATHHPVRRYCPPEEFMAWEKEALIMGFKAVASGPLVRSSFKAGILYRQALTHRSSFASRISDKEL